MTRAVPQIAVAFVEAHEGCKLTAYQDAGAGVWTVGVGHCGPEVKAGLTITQQQADDYLRSDLALAAERLAGVVRDAAIQRLSEHQYAALLSFVFNVGAGDGWAIWTKLNSLQFDAVPAQMQRFVYAGGKIVPGLVSRRAAEVALWNTPDAPPPPVVAAPVVAAAQPAPPSSNGGFLSRIWNRFAA
jgi:lysozyme